MTSYVLLWLQTVSGSPILAEAINDPVYQYAGDLADDHDFLAPHDLCQNAIGLLFCLTTKRLTGTSFSTLYHRRYFTSSPCNLII